MGEEEEEDEEGEDEEGEEGGDVEPTTCKKKNTLNQLDFILREIKLKYLKVGERSAHC